MASVLWYDRKGFVLSGDMPVDELQARITRRFPVRTAEIPTFFEPMRRDGQPYAIFDEIPVETLAFELVGMRGDIYIYREVID
jgi:hypothetical protein